MIIICIAILQNEGAVITRRELKNCWTNNPDGAGMAWVENGEIKIHKELNSFRNFYKSYRKVVVENGNSSKMLVHFRWATHGLVDVDNCHPHMVHDNLAFIHNGIISIGNGNEAKSDTVLFNEAVLRHLPVNFIHRKKTLSHVERRAKSILIFLDSDNSYKIVGEMEGTWDGGRWFSNYDYCYIGKYTGISKHPDYGNYPDSSGYTFCPDDDSGDREWDNDGENHNTPTTMVCDDNWERYYAEHYGKSGMGEVDYSSDSMQDIPKAVNILKKGVNRIRARRNGTPIRGMCFRCGCHTENLKLSNGHWYCPSCIHDLSDGFTNDAYGVGSVGGICTECGSYDDDLISFNSDFYCHRCYELFTV